jgi:transcriptional/translational regulatory protein YebC/TACO1
MNKFTNYANEVLNQYLSNTTEYQFIDGEARTRVYVKLKRSNELHKLFENNGVLQLHHEWTDKLLEHYITAHEGDLNTNEGDNKIMVYEALKAANDLYLLFEEHYSYDNEALL